MRRLNLWLLVMALAFTLMHIGYFVSEYVQKPFGAYFVSGVLLLGTGKALVVESRLQFQGDGVHDYQQSGGWSSSAFRTIERSLWGSLKLVTESARVSSRRIADAPVDSDLAFGHAYYIKKGTAFTLYRLPLSSEDICVYIRELSRLSCFSRERPKSM